MKFRVGKGGVVDSGRKRLDADVWRYGRVAPFVVISEHTRIAGNRP